MLNKLGRKRMTITVGKRKPTLADEVDAMVTISVTKTDNPIYTEVVIPKPRPTEGNHAQYEIMRGCTHPIIPFDDPLFSLELAVAGVQNKIAEDMTETIKAGGVNPQEGIHTPMDLEAIRKQQAADDWSDLD